MADQLDPTDAIVSAFGGTFLAFVTAIAVVIGGHFQAVALHDLVPLLPTLRFPSVDVPEMIFSWIGVVVGSFATWRGYPFLLLDIFLIARVRSGASFFSTLLILAVSQPLHSLLILDRFSPMGGGSLGFAIALWFGSSIAIVVLALWWRRTSENAPAMEPTDEPEL